jgi:replication-associated recombination protein RarA
MTPQEKAEDLFMMYVNKGMNQIKPVINRVIRKKMAKQCALIAVDEIIRVLQDEQDWYWQEVKQEIEKL